MPQYLTRKGNTFYFRQGVPEELRAILGRREIKKSLGRDYAKAVQGCKRYAVDADNLIAEARAKLDSVPLDPYSCKAIRRTKPIELTKLTTELEVQFGNLMRAALLEGDQNKRIAGLTREEFANYGQEINAALDALRMQLAMGQIEPMLGPASIFLTGRGYTPDFTDDEWRRLAYVLTEASLEAYEGMAARQRGAVVKTSTVDILPSQYEVQSAARNVVILASDEPSISWQNLYDVWVKECDRPERTRAAYLAAIEWFKEFRPEATPLTATREDALAYRNYLRDDLKLAPGTISNKLGFLATIINSGLDDGTYSKILKQNHFGGIRVKKAKKGEADKKRRPFSDADLKAIFGSKIYTENSRPLGGCGEAAAWIPAIAYLSGANLEEIAVLTKSQFHVDARGNHYFQVGDSKNDNRADREVPLHPHLIEAGLLEYVKSCSGRLFPKVKSANEVQSAAFSKWFGRHLDTLHITSKSKVFHSFRHLFKDLCRNAGLDDSAVDQICGHEPGTEGGKYGEGRRIDVLAGLLATVKPPIKLPVITAQEK